jgi:hypothetical protein
MKLIITENKLNDVVIKFLNKNYSDLKPYETENYPFSIFYIRDGEIFFEYNKENGRVYISYEHIWSFLERIFSMEYKQIQEVTKLWLEERYNFRTTTTRAEPPWAVLPLEERYKLKKNNL